jgi:undecaprenyl-diphosphatase
MPGLGSFLPVLAAGFLAAAVFGWLAVKWLLRYLGRHSLAVFAVYCAVLSAGCLAWNFL